MGGFEPGEDVVWVGPGQWELPGRHGGYPMSIIEARMCVDEGQYVIGRVLEPNGDPTNVVWTLLLPYNQPRARFHAGLMQYVPPWGPPPPTAVGRVAAPAHATVVPEPDYRAAADAFLHRRAPGSRDVAG